jgi:hypothetical protein
MYSFHVVVTRHSHMLLRRQLQPRPTACRVGQKSVHSQLRHFSQLPKVASLSSPMAGCESGVSQLLADSHAHPQLDVLNINHTLHLQAPHIAAMGVAVNVDWEAMSLLAEAAGKFASSLYASRGLLRRQATRVTTPYACNVGCICIPVSGHRTMHAIKPSFTEAQLG